MLIGLFVSRDQNNKDGQQVRKALTFQTKTNIFHHYKGILLVKPLWQNQNYQLILGGSRDWSLVIWLIALTAQDSDPDPSGWIWPTSTQTLLLIHKPFSSQNT